MTWSYILSEQPPTPATVGLHVGISSGAPALERRHPAGKLACRQDAGAPGGVLNRGVGHGPLACRTCLPIGNGRSLTRA